MSRHYCDSQRIAAGKVCLAKHRTELSAKRCKDSHQTWIDRCRIPQLTVQDHLRRMTLVYRADGNSSIDIERYWRLQFEQWLAHALKEED